MQGHQYVDSESYKPILGTENIQDGKIIIEYGETKCRECNHVSYRSFHYLMTMMIRLNIFSPFHLDPYRSALIQKLVMVWSPLRDTRVVLALI